MRLTVQVLSVNKALSIQSHPDKQLAEQLHAQHPKLYPDDNHKPEMALAISDGFEALCSFRQPQAIAAQLRKTAPEVVQLLGQGAVEALESSSAQQEPKEALRNAFSALMTANPASISSAIDAIVARLSTQANGSSSGQGNGAAGLDPHESLVLRLNSQYPGGDVGVLASLFLNRVSLNSGQAVYLAANEPHAYLAGEIVEVMASSDNVVRAGLTPKFKDCDVLRNTLTYRPGLPEVLQGTSLPLVEKEEKQGFQVSLYRPPFEEFEVLRVHVAGGSSGVLPPNEGPMIVLVQGGKGSMQASGGSVSKHLCGEELQERVDVARGCVLFVPAGTQLTFTSTPGEEPMLAWVSAVNGIFFQLHGAVHGAGGANPAAAGGGAEALSLQGGVAAVPTSQLQGSSMAN
ncbi:RmlC-like cupin domain-containing protein [Dunaliella salina]|uniref:mannose-6-phosphate isomerase n=1 Tax=Dunaliella salina TaxID=3046 RepID=A0ABQ7G2Q6_DUNSA|nr:RmlC-like cupin domain-containing protein [Dunaliella salina]|eukprot:KAF5828881.1 RmlC-like cupin domain-containing protein [Dunaliella salina]